MNAKKCDRCGKYYIGSEWNYEQLVKQYIFRIEAYKVLSKTGGLERGLPMDLCPECCKKLLNFMSMVKDEEKN